MTEDVLTLAIQKTELGYAHQVPVQYFLDQILPPLRPEINLDRVLRRLKYSRARGRRAITKGGRWWGFSSNPSTSTKCPGETYKRFVGVVNSIARAGSSHAISPEFTLLHKKAYENAEEVPGQDLPDAYVVPTGVDKNRLSWADVAVVGEYQKQSAEWRSGRVRVLYASGRAILTLFLSTELLPSHKMPLTRNAKPATTLHVRILCRRYEDGAMVLRSCASHPL